METSHWEMIGQLRRIKEAKTKKEADRSES